MDVLQIEFTIKGASDPQVLRYKTKTIGMEMWDLYVEMATGGDTLRLVDLETGNVISSYNPVDREGWVE